MGSKSIHWSHLLDSGHQLFGSHINITGTPPLFNNPPLLMLVNSIRPNSPRTLPPYARPANIPYPLKVEHHLFPAISFVHYPAIARIVRDECAKRGVRYTHYKTLLGNLSGFLCCMQQLGVAPDEPSVAAKGTKAN